MGKSLTQLIEYHNSVSRILKIHFRGARVMAYLNDGSKIYGEVSVKNDQLFIDGQAITNKLITELFYTDKKRSASSQSLCFQKSCESPFPKRRKSGKKS